MVSPATGSTNPISWVMVDSGETWETWVMLETMRSGQSSTGAIIEGWVAWAPRPWEAGDLGGRPIYTDLRDSPSGLGGGP